MIVVDVGTAEQLGDVEFALAQLPGVLGGNDSQYTRSCLRSPYVDRCDASLGDARADHIAISLVCDDVMPIGRIRGGASRLQWSVDAIDGLAHDLELVDRIGTSRSVEPHGQPFASARAASSVRSTSCSLKAF
ncbi:hypothetical protein D9M69_565990 [compost metagenome]